jgi:ATP-dependent DNA helicase RecG
VVHRDYTRLGAVHVQWHADRIEVSNPGGFVEGVRLDNLLVTPPRPRNPVLADAFKRIGLVERTGRGIDTIFEGQLRYGRPAPDYSLSTSEGVHVLLPGGRANLALARLIAVHDTPERPVGVDQLLLLNAAERERRLDVAHAAELIQKPETTARATLERLVELALLEARGDRNRSYHLSAAAYREMGEPAGHTRVRNFEPIQQEQMVLQYVAAHGRITRGEVAELCRIEPEEARRLLRRLVKRRELVMRGERRWSFYERPNL